MPRGPPAGGNRRGRDHRRRPGGAAVTVVLWASGFVAIRSAGSHFSPGALALGRLLVASAALGVVWAVSGHGWPPRAAWPGIAGSGLLWFGLHFVALSWGEREVDAGTAAMLVNIGPLTTFGCAIGAAAAGSSCSPGNTMAHPRQDRRCGRSPPRRHRR